MTTSRLAQCGVGAVVCAAWLALAGPGWAGGAPLPVDGAGRSAAVAGEEPAAPAATPAPRDKLLIVPEAVLEDAARDRTFVTAGSVVTGVSGNAGRYRRYYYTEPSRAFVLDSLRAMGTDGDREVMYEIGLRGPGLHSSGADLLVRGFDAATTLRAEWDRNDFLRDFGPAAGPATRTNLAVLGRARLGGETWVDVTYARRDYASPLGSTRPVGFRTDELGARVDWTSGDTTFQAAVSVSRYVDRTAGISRTGGWLRANRVTTRASVSAASADDADLQWRVAAGWRSARYPVLGGQRATSLSTAAGVQYRAGGHMLLNAAVSYVAAPRTITANTYNPASATVRLSGTYTGLRHLRTSFGYERRIGRRYSVRPDLTTPQGFTESQTVDRLWLTGRIRNRSKFTLEYALRYRRVDGSVTSYLGNQTAVVPVLLYPEQTSFEISSSYPADLGLVAATLSVGRFRNPGRGVVVGSVGFSALWMRSWSGRWSALAQYDHIRYVSSGAPGATVDCDLGGWTTSLSYAHGKASITGSYATYRTIGTFRALTADARLTCSYRAAHDLSLGLTLARQIESGTGPLAYDGHSVVLTGAYEF